MHNFSISETFISLTRAKSDGLSLNNSRTCFTTRLASVINFIYFIKNFCFLNRLFKFMKKFILVLSDSLTLYYNIRH